MSIMHNGKPVKIIKNLPQYWEETNLQRQYKADCNHDLAEYCRLLFASLMEIKQDYENKFNRLSTTPIQDYIDFFNEQYSKIADVLLNAKAVKNFEISMHANNPEYYTYITRFFALKESDCINSGVLKIGFDGKPYGYSDSAYAIIKPLVTNIFLIDKLCSFVTKKFWQEEITSLSDLSLKGNFKILIKTVFAENWRRDKVSPTIKKFHQDRIYQSASLIDNKHKYSFFGSRNNFVKAWLVMGFDQKKFMCANSDDSFSDESINNANPLIEKNVYTDVLLQGCTKKGEKEHKLYAVAVEAITPKFLLKHMYDYSEVNLQDTKPVAVINLGGYENTQFAKKQAQKFDVPVLDL